MHIYEEVEKAKALVVLEVVEYLPNSIVSKTIIKKATGSISLMSFEAGEILTEKTSPFDSFAQIVDGEAEILIDGISNLLTSGQAIVLPAHIPNIIKANERFKMLLTLIKSEYE